MTRKPAPTKPNPNAKNEPAKRLEDNDFSTDGPIRPSDGSAIEKTSAGSNRAKRVIARGPDAAAKSPARARPKKGV